MLAKYIKQVFSKDLQEHQTKPNQRHEELKIMTDVMSNGGQHIEIAVLSITTKLCIRNTISSISIATEIREIHIAVSKV